MATFACAALTSRRSVPTAPLARSRGSNRRSAQALVARGTTARAAAPVTRSSRAPPAPTTQRGAVPTPTRASRAAREPWRPAQARRAASSARPAPSKMSRARRHASAVPAVTRAARALRSPFFVPLGRIASPVVVLSALRARMAHTAQRARMRRSRAPMSVAAKTCTKTARAHQRMTASRATRAPTSRAPLISCGLVAAMGGRTASAAEPAPI